MTAVMANRDSVANPSGKTQKELKSRIPPGCSSNPVKLDKKPFPMTGVLVHETQPPDGSVFRPMPQTMDNVSQPQDYTGPACVRFDDQGMILPHSILGNLEGFRKYLESKGDTELLRHVPDHRREHPAETRVQKGMLVEECSVLPSGHIHTQSNSLEHWNTCIKQRRRQEDFLSGLLHRPVENLLMKQGDRFRQIQEQKEILSQVLPTIQSGYGYRVGSEFWSLPQHYGDEKSGITATLTRTEQGVREAVARVGRPFITRQELGNVGAELSRPSAQAWIHSEYLEKQHRELREVLADLDYNPPDIDGLAGKPITYITVCEIPSLDKDKGEAAPREEEINHDSLARSDDIMLDTLLIPALRFCGQSAHWTGSSTSHQGEVGVSVRMNFEALTGERASSHLELHNEGSTAVYCSWQQLQLPCSFPNLVAQTTTPHFYFNSSTAVILPGDTQRVEFTFKSEVPGIKRELWQLNTHPVLLGGASMQVTLRGLAVYQDTMAEKRHAIEMELQRRVAEKTCQSLLYELLQGVGSPERCSSPADLYITEEQEFLCRNPKLQYHFEPIEALKRLWQDVSPGSIWNLSVHTLRQAVLSLPEKQLDSAQDSLTRDRGLCQLNSLLLELSRPLLQHAPLTSVTIGRQLWRELLDRMAAEAVRLRQLLGLPETDTWTEQSQHPQITDAYSEDKLKKQEKTEKKGGMAATEEEEKKGDKKGASKSAKEKLPEERSKKGRGALEGGKQLGGKQGEKDQSLTIEQQHPRSDDHSIRPEIREKYRRLLHQQVHVLMGGLVDSLCDLAEELKETFVKNIV